MKRRKVLPVIIVLVSLLLVSCATTQKVSTKVIPDTARVVRLYVPACTWEDTEAEIREILMKIDGVYDVKGDTNNMYVYVTFDPAKTDVSAFIKALSPKSYFVRGAPVFIK